MKSILSIFAVFGLTAAFNSNFQYGCQDSHCSFQLIVPKEVAQFIDEQQLTGVIAQISTNMHTLNITANSGTGAANLANFTQAFNSTITPINAQADSLAGSVSGALLNSTALLADGENADQTAKILYDAIKCFQNASVSSYHCFSAQTTLGPATTTVAATTIAPGTVVPVTDVSGTTVSAASPVTGGTTALPVTGDTSATDVTSVTGLTSGTAATDSASSSGTTESVESSTGASGTTTEDPDSNVEF